ncbi:hypothetical protein F5B19DRAFT_477509 [Rostrohypoxylon terebratum]|nr:hypothetical protein F5B19DRAFT_477509 [Rostrohypoxylon terebratum]
MKPVILMILCTCMHPHCAGIHTYIVPQRYVRPYIRIVQLYILGIGVARLLGRYSSLYM